MMNKKAAVLIAVLALMSASAYAAPDRTGKVDIGVDVAAAIATDSDTNAGVYVGGNLSYGFNEWFAGGVSFGGHVADIDDVTSSGVTIFGPDVSEFSIFGDMILRVPVGDSPVQPYGVVGLGAIFWNIDDTTSSNGVTVTTDIDTAFGVKVGGGVDWFVNDHWIVNFNGAYVFNDADGTATASAGGATASVTEKFDLDYWTVGGGLKYLF
jgi:hypothetical protein